MSFTVKAPHFDLANRVATFTYELDGKAFTETLKFPEGGEPERAETENFRLLLNLAAAIQGTSYFKLKAPLDIHGEDVTLTPAALALVRDAYENGLGEFYARNGLTRFGRLTFMFGSSRPPEDGPPLPSRALLPIGGGKDSLASVQLLERAGIPFTPFAVNPRGPILTSIERTGLDPVYVERHLDPEMIRLAKLEEYYDGHVPVTAINSVIASLSALLFGHDRIILSNERSASEGNQIHDHREVNHQHSKSMESETLISTALAETSGGTLGYFSLLRPYSETRIGELFARQARFDDVFSSCNRNFRLAGHEGGLWCGNCPKCHFVFLILAPFMTRERLVGIFGQDLLDQPQHTGAYRELTGLAGQKPWECVGEILEAAAALWQVANSPDWQRAAICRELRRELAGKYGEKTLIKAWDELMADDDTHLIPADIRQKVSAHAG